jgi:quercetin 2,3-dioxygenase
MEYLLHRATERGHNQFSWLDSYHSFSFGHYFDENKIHFGALRVLNDDTVAPGGGFGTHPHDNMEIVSIPLEGALEHKDSIGSVGVIRSGDVQIMSAGTGIMHSEYNHSSTELVKFLQIWIFPRERQLTPRYDQKHFGSEGRASKWQVVVDPAGNEGVLINQESWFSMADLKAGEILDYKFHRPGNGVYLFVLNGKASVENEILETRGAMGIWDTGEFNISAMEECSLLAIEIPMNLV